MKPAPPVTSTCFDIAATLQLLLGCWVAELPGFGNRATEQPSNLATMILVTGAAGFIGYHVSKRLLERGERVVGLDNLNAYYDPNLKEARLAQLKNHHAFTFAHVDIADTDSMQE